MPFPSNSNIQILECKYTLASFSVCGSMNMQISLHSLASAQRSTRLLHF